MPRETEYPEILQDMGEAIVQALTRSGVAIEVASEAAWEATEKVRDRWGGTDPYIPKGERLELAQRDREIFSSYLAGHRYIDIAREHDLSEARVRVIVNCARLSRAQRVEQKALFNVV